MRLLYLTAGAAEMYCGSCLRDNALAAALLARGHDVVLTPVYTPTTTDEPNVSASQVLFGGVSVYLEQHVPLFRHTPAFLDRLWDSTPVLKLASKRQIKVDPAVLGEMTVSMLQGRRRDSSARKSTRCCAGSTHEPRFDVVNTAVHAAHRPGEAAARGAARAHRLHAAGRGSVSREPAGAVEVAVARADSRRASTTSTCSSP